MRNGTLTRKLMFLKRVNKKLLNKQANSFNKIMETI